MRFSSTSDAGKSVSKQEAQPPTCPILLLPSTQNVKRTTGAYTSVPWTRSAIQWQETQEDGRSPAA